MESQITPTSRARSAFTLVEMMVAIGISTVLLAAVMSFYLYSNRTFVSMTNHVFMGQHNQFAMDYLSQQIRQVKQVTAYTTNSVTFTDYDTNSLQFTYDPNTQRLLRIKQGLTNTMLTGCTSLQFSLYPDTVQSNAFDVTAVASDISQCKVVGVTWTCIQTAVGLTNIEQVQTAKILIRNINGG
jgi:prepilin-type N-terminal cleavage/methylation domain-containing protein